ncbi:MAG: hypothetical protein HQ517_05035 [SAR324 cluster bacterium]|nr:hypothetical protein [SAR324 cluster bacterium]
MKANSNFGSRVMQLGILLLFLLATGPVRAAETLKIQGSILTDQKTPASNVTVALMKIVMQGKPTISLLKQSLTDGEGRYEFLIEPLTGKTFFRVEASSEQSMVSSEPFTFSADQLVKNIALVLPKVQVGMANLEFNRDILVVEALEKTLRITEIIRFSNNSGGVVTVENGPYVKRIPVEALNFQFFQGKNRFEATKEKDRILFRLLVPPGDNQLYFSYELPVNKRSFVLLNHLPPLTKEIELITPVKTLELSFDKRHRISSGRVVKQEKSFSNERYDSQTLILEGNIEEISVVIGNIPISRARFYYPAILLAVLLLFGFSFFLIRRSQPVPESK